MENDILKKYIAVDLEFAFSRIIDNLEKSNEKLLKLEKEVVNIEKHKNEREKEMEV